MRKVIIDHKFLMSIEMIGQRENVGMTDMRKLWQKENDQKKIKNTPKGIRGIPTNMRMKILVVDGIQKRKGVWLQIKIN